jgi:hypothetical protein
MPGVFLLVQIHALAGCVSVYALLALLLTKNVSYPSSHTESVCLSRFPGLSLTFHRFPGLTHPQLYYNYSNHSLLNNSISTMQPPSGEKKLLLSKVPSIKELCDNLGILDTNGKSANPFLDTIHYWRRTYKTLNNKEGSKLTLWNDKGTQEDLRRMAQKFVESHHEKFWPQGARGLQYPDDNEK